jgi:DNA-binding protein HU-alpha
MNKTELIDEMEKALNSKKEAKLALESLLSAITHALKEKDTVTLTGLGTFKVTHRKARTVKNIQTGKIMPVKAKHAPKFTPGKKLKDAIN